MSLIGRVCRQGAVSICMMAVSIRGNLVACLSEVSGHPGVRVSATGIPVIAMTQHSHLRSNSKKKRKISTTYVTLNTKNIPNHDPKHVLAPHNGHLPAQDGMLRVLSSDFGHNYLELDTTTKVTCVRGGDPKK